MSNKFDTIKYIEENDLKGVLNMPNTDSSTITIMNVLEEYASARIKHITQGLSNLHD
jgi:hypothetical protein